MEGIWFKFCMLWCIQFMSIASLDRTIPATSFEGSAPADAAFRQVSNPLTAHHPCQGERSLLAWVHGQEMQCESEIYFELKVIPERWWYNFSCQPFSIRLIKCSTTGTCLQMHGNSTWAMLNGMWLFLESDILYEKLEFGCKKSSGWNVEFLLKSVENWNLAKNRLSESSLWRG